MKNRVKFTGANKLFFSFAAIFFASQVVLVFLTALYGENFLRDNVYKVLLVNQYVIVLIPVLVYTFKNKLDLKKTFRLNNPGLLPLLLITAMSLPAYIAALMLNTIVMYFIQFIGKVPVQTLPIPQNLAEFGVGVLVIAVSPAICEELFHRGVLLSAYENRGSIRGLVISSVFFGLFHFDLNNLVGPIFLGLIIGYYVLRTNSIFSGMLAHFLNNFIALLLQYISPETVSNSNLEIKTTELVSVIIIGVACMLILAALMTLFRLSTRGKYEFKPAIGSVRDDFVSLATHWPVIIVVILYIGSALLYLLSIFIYDVAA